MTKSLFDAFRLAMLSAGPDSRKAAEDSFLAAMRADPRYLELLARDYFERMAAKWTVQEHRPGSLTFVPIHTDEAAEAKTKVDRPALTPQSRAEALARSVAAIGGLKARLRAVILLDLTLPDGKKLREATGAECTRAGGFFAAVAKSIKPTEVVDRKLTEADLQNIRARYYQPNEAAA